MLELSRNESNQGDTTRRLEMGKPGAAVRAAGWVTVGAIAAGGVATAATTTGSGSKPATATTTATTPSTTQPAPASQGQRRQERVWRPSSRGRLLHGQATVLGKDGKPVVVAEQRGTVAAVSAHLDHRLTSKDGFKQTYVVTSTTRVRVDGKKSSIGQVKPGQPAGVVAKVDGSTQTALIIIERAPKAAPAS